MFMYSAIVTWSNRRAWMRKFARCACAASIDTTASCRLEISTSSCGERERERERGSVSVSNMALARCVWAAQQRYLIALGITLTEARAERNVEDEWYHVLDRELLELGVSLPLEQHTPKDLDTRLDGLRR